MGNHPDKGGLQAYHVKFKEKYKLGEGGFGTVFKAVHKNTQKTYALKQMAHSGKAMFKSDELSF